MKINRTALAAAASVVAVVVAGTAALAANFGILSGGEDQVTTPRVLSTLSDELVVDVPVEDVTDAEVGETLAYQVEGVGVVTLERTGDSLATVSVDADSDWVHTELPAEQGVAIRFESGSEVIAFSAAVVDGQVIVDVVDETPVPSAGTHDDDDDSHGGSESDDDDSYEDD